MQNHVLIIGASGLVGTAAANAFIEAGDWQITTSSRRSPEWVEGTFDHIRLDLRDVEACAQQVSALAPVTHVVYAAVHELPGLIQGWSDPDQIATNDRMLRNLLEPLLAHHPVQHISLLQGTKAYGGAVKPMRIPAREDQPRVEHANFYWQQEDYLREQAAEHSLQFTILRPQLIVGPNYGVVMNLPPVIGVYAAIRQHEGLPFSFPGGAEWVWEAVDVRLVGNACVWAANSQAAFGQTFNLTNGEVFSWRDMWPALARVLGVETGPDTPLDVASYLNDRAGLWDEVVAKHNLKAIALDDVLGESHHYANLCFASGAQLPPPPTFVSTMKIKQAGFSEVMNTEESFCYWLGRLQEARILPAP